MTTPAEQKAKHREKKSILINILIASIIIGFSLVSTFFEFESLSSQLVMAALIVAATIIAFILIVRWLKSIDEYEYQINAKACLIALYSSLFYLPLQYLSEIGLLPEIHVGIFFMFLWAVYTVSLIAHHFNKI